MAYTLKAQDKELFTQNPTFKGRVLNVLMDNAKAILKTATAPNNVKSYKIYNKLSQIAQYGLSDKELAQLIRLCLTGVSEMGDQVAPGGTFDINIAVSVIQDEAIETVITADFEVFAGVQPGDAATAWPQQQA